MTACLSAVLLLCAGAAASAADLGKLDPLQGDWAVGRGSVFTVSGSSGSLTKVSAADRAAGYSQGDLLVQGLTYRGSVELNSGDIRARFTGTCRSPTQGQGKVQWVVSDCELRLVLPTRAGAGHVLTTQNGSPLIASRRAADGQTAATGPSIALPGPPPGPEDPNYSWSRSRMNPAELAAQDAGTAKANAEINARNAAAAARDRKAAADFAAAKAAHAARVKAAGEAYEAEMAAYRARVAATEAANARARAQWEADVAACKAGDRSRCAKTAAN